MKNYELTVVKPTRLFFVIITFGISLTGLFILGLNIESSYLKILIPLTIFVLFVVFAYHFAFGKLILKHSNDKIDFEWKRNFLFYNKNLESIIISDIKIAVIDKGSFLKKVFTNDKIIDINNTKPISDNYRLFLESLIQTILDNKGQVIDSNIYNKAKGYSDFSFQLTIALLAFSIFLISRIWEHYSYDSLLLLLLPTIVYLIHVKLRIKKKNGR